jgi:hypothetical protein
MEEPKSSGAFGPIASGEPDPQVSAWYRPDSPMEEADRPGSPHDRFVDLETGGEGAFPTWSDVPFEVPESWAGGCEVFVDPDGRVAQGLCW